MPQRTTTHHTARPSRTTTHYAHDPQTRRTIAYLSITTHPDGQTVFKIGARHADHFEQAKQLLITHLERLPQRALDRLHGRISHRSDELVEVYGRDILFTRDCMPFIKTTQGSGEGEVAFKVCDAEGRQVYSAMGIVHYLLGPEYYVEV
jgi:hypothetical protein